MISAVVLIILILIVLSINKEPKKLTEVKERYQILRQHLRQHPDPEFKKLEEPVVISGYYFTVSGILGYNTNKGAEIGLCIDGTTNEIFHVLIHELAHCTVPEYSHSALFWERCKKLKDICANIGIYEPIPNKTRFCGGHIQDK